MLKITIVILVFAFIGCKNSSEEQKDAKVVDTSFANVPMEKKMVLPDQSEGSKVSNQDTIRDYTATQMSDDNIQKATIYLGDSSLTIFQNIRADYRIFGYEKPDTNARKMIFFSVFTTDVEGNSYNCPYGSYYGSSSLSNSSLKYSSDAGEFVKANLIKENNEKISSIYFLRKLVEFEKVN